MEMKAAANGSCPRARCENFKWLVLSETTLRASTLTTQREKISHLRESGTEIWRFYMKYSAASRSSLFDWLIISLSLVVTCGRDLKTRSFSHLNVSAAVTNGWGTRVYWWVARYVRHDLFICPKRAWSITAAPHFPVSAPFFCCALCHLCEPLITLFQSCHSVSDANARPPGYLGGPEHSTRVTVKAYLFGIYGGNNQSFANFDSDGEC